MVIAIALATLLTLAFYELAEDFALVAGVDAFDRHVSAIVQAWRSPALTVVFKAFTFIGNTSTMVVLTALLAGVLVRRKLRREASTLIEAVAGGALLSTIVKGVTGRARPPAATALIKLPASFSFPSGHAMASLMFFGTLAYLAQRSPRFSPAEKTASVVACVLAAVLVGVSRVYLGVHWPSDVIASWCLGGAWFALVVGLVEAS